MMALSFAEQPQLVAPTVPKPSSQAIFLFFKKARGNLDRALQATELDWSSKRLDDEDAKVAAYVIASNGSLNTLE